MSLTQIVAYSVEEARDLRKVNNYSLSMRFKELAREADLALCIASNEARHNVCKVLEDQFYGLLEEAEAFFSQLED